MAAVVLALALRRPRIALLVFAADACGELVADALKALVPRHRPRVHQLGPHLATHSFPSGHATTSFACATMIGALVPRLRIPALVLAALVALSRLYNGVHYPTDVVAGALLGVATATALLPLSGRRRASRRARRRG